MARAVNTSADHRKQSRPTDRTSLWATLWKRWLTSLVMGLLLWFLVSRFAQIETITKTLERGRWQCLLAAAACQCLYYWLYALNYQYAFQLVGIAGRAWELLPVLLGSLTLGEVAPFGWAAGSALFIRHAAARGTDPPRAAVATLLAQAADLLAFFVLFALGMLFLFRQHDLRRYELVSAAMLLVMNLALVGLLATGLWRPESFCWLSRWSPAANRLITNLTLTADTIRACPHRLAAPLGAALGAQGVNLFSLFLVFQAFGQTIRLGPLVAGYGIGTLTWMLSPIPSGIGMVEGAIALVYTSLGVPAGSAAVISVAYRGLSFWFPFLAGIPCLRRLNIAEGIRPP